MTSLYEVKTLCNVQVPHSETHETSILSQSTGSEVLIAVKKNLFLVKKDSSNVDSSLQLESKIDAIAWDDDANYVVIGDQSGSIHILNKTGFDIIFTQPIPGFTSNLDKDASCFLSIICSTSKLNGYCISVALTSGKVIIFDNINLDVLSITDNTVSNEPFVQEIKKNLVTYFIDTKSYHNQLISMISISSQFKNEFLTMGHGDRMMILWRMDNMATLFDLKSFYKASLTVNQSRLKKCISGFDGEYFVKTLKCFSSIFALNNKGNLLQFDSSTLIWVKFWPKLNLKDFIVKMPAPANRNTGMLHAKLYGVDKDTNDVKVYQFSDTKQIFTESCTYGSQSICSVQPKINDLFCIEGPVCQVGQENEIIVKCVMEALPENRLSNLLDQHLFTKALEIATQFKLDTEQIYQKKAAYLLNSLVFEEDVDLQNKKYVELQECINKTCNVLYIGELICNVFHPVPSMNFKLLNLGRDLLVSGGRLFKASLNDEELSSELQLRADIDSLLDLHVTFDIIFDDRDPELWNRFRMTPLSIEFVRFLAAGNLRAANLILLRHSNELIDHLESSEMLKATIDKIPEEFNVNDLSCFLETLIQATLMSNIKGSIEVIAQWVIKRVEQLEEIAAENWPFIGLHFAETFFNAQKVVSRIGLRDQISWNLLLNKTPELTQLAVLVDILKALANLKNRYNCIVTLQEYKQETTYSLTYRIIDKVVRPELIPSFFENTVRPYMREHSLDEKKIILEYIMELISNCKEYDIGAMQSIVEGKIIAIIQCLNDKQMYVKATLALTKIAFIPWSTKMENLGKNALNVVTDLYEQAVIEESSQYSKEGEKTNLFLGWKEDLNQMTSHNAMVAITTKYDYYVSTSYKELRVQMFMKYLIKLNQPEALDDAVKVAKAFTSFPEIEVYNVRLTMLITQKWFTDQSDLQSKCCYILDNFPKIATVLMDNMIQLTRLYLDKLLHFDENIRFDFCVATLGMLKHLILKEIPKQKRRAYYKELDFLTCVFNLKKNFNEWISIKDFNNKKKRDEILSRCTSQQCETSNIETSARLRPNDSLGSLSVSNKTINLATMTKLEISGDAPLEKKKENSLANLFSIGQILQVPQECIQAQIAIQASKNCQGPLSIRICSEIYDTSPCYYTANALHKVALNLLDHLEIYPKQIFSILPDIYEILCRAVSCCEPVQTLVILPVVMFCRLAKDMYLATDDATKIYLSKGGIGNFNDVNFLETWYRENDGLSLKADLVYHLLAKLKLIFFSQTGVPLSYQQPKSIQSTAKLLEEMNKVVSQINSLLDSNFRFTLAMQWTSITTSFVISFLNNHCCFFNKDTKTKSIICHLINETTQKAKKLTYNYSKILAKKVILSQNCDAMLASALLSNLPFQKAFEFLHNICESIANNLNKVAMVAAIGLKLAINFGELSKQEEYSSLLRDATWASKLVIKKISIDGFLLSSLDWKKSYLLKNMSSPNVVGPMLLDFIRDYDLDLDFFLFQYVKILLGGEVSLNEKTEEIFSPNAVALVSGSIQPFSPFANDLRTFSDKKSDEEEKKFDKRVKTELRWVVQNIGNKFKLMKHLEKCFLYNVCPYNYDRCEFMLKLIKLCGCDNEGEIDVDEGLKILDYLRHFKRVHPPSIDFEIKQGWRNTIFGDFSVTKLSKLAQTRLPLHILLIGDLSLVWDLLSKQANKYSVVYLVPIAQILGINFNKVYLSAANNIIKQLKSTADDDQNKAVKQNLADILEILEKIQDFKVVMAMAKSLLDSMPPGENKVEVCKWCQTVVEKWLAMEDVDKRESILLLQQVLIATYKVADTATVLINNNLNSSEAMSLIRKPMQLISFLYQHKSILQRIYKPNGVYPDIHAVVTHLAELHGKNPLKLNLELIQRMLLAAETSSNNEKDKKGRNAEGMQLDGLFEAKIKDESEMDFIRLLYLLEYGDSSKHIEMLLALLSNHTDDRITNTCKIRALNCLLHIADDERLVKETNKTREQLEVDLRVLVYLKELESVNFRISSSQLLKKDKSSVVRSIVASVAHRNDPVALGIAAEMCHEFGPVASDTWSVVLQQMVALKQVAHLRELLPEICKSKKIRLLSCLASVWQSCVMLPLVGLILPLDKKQNGVALSSFEFMMKCPVLIDLDLSVVAKQYCNVNLHFLALACLLLSHDQQKNAEDFAMKNIKIIRDGMADLNTESDSRYFYINAMVTKFLRKI